MSRLYAAVALLLVGLVAGVLLRPATGTGQTANKEAEVAPVEAALDQPLAEVWIDQLPLRDALAKIGSLAHVSIWLANDFGDTPVTVRLRNATLAEVLDAATASASSEKPDSPVTIDWDCSADEVRVGPSEQVHDDPVVRMYPVRQVSDPKELDGFFGGCLQPRNELVALLQDCIAPESWRDVGGPFATVRAYGSNLLVFQTRRRHREIRTVLRALSNTAVAEFDTSHWEPRIQKWVTNANAAGDQALNRQVKQFVVRDVSPREAIEQLAEIANLDVVFDPPDEPVGDVAVSISLHDSPVWKILEGINRTEVARRKSPGDLDPVRSFDWGVEGSLIVITSGPATPPLSTEAYPVGDLLESMGDGSSGSTGAAGAGEKASKGGPLSKESAAQGIALLSARIVEQVEPASWVVERGKTLNSLGNTLIITQTWRNQQAVKALLQSLRDAATGGNSRLNTDTVPAQDAQLRTADAGQPLPANGR